MSLRTHGPTIGFHLGKPIFESICQDDTKYVFDRIAQCDSDGCPLSQLEKDELLLKPGLIYKEAKQILSA